MKGICVRSGLLVADGATTLSVSRDIAGRLNVAEAAVKTYLTRIFTDGHLLETPRGAVRSG